MIADAVMERYQGRLQLVSTPGKGATLVVWLPLTQAEQQAQEAPPPLATLSTALGLASKVEPCRIALSSAPEERLQALQATRFFQPIAPDLVASVLRDAYLVTLPPGHLLMRQGSTDTDAIFFILAGSVDVFTAGHYILSQTEPGEAIGEIGALTNVPRTADVLTATSCTLLEISKASTAGLRQEDPQRYIQFLELMTKYLAEKVSVTTRKVRAYEDFVSERRHGPEPSAEMDEETRRRLRQILLYSAVIRRSQDGILIASPEGRILSCNPAAAALVSHGVSLAEGGDLLALFPQLRPVDADVGSDWRTPRREEWQLPGPDGPLAVEVSIS
ncbi:MAG TPA: cyclic nucleotide-binding domain-containing protein, partial [bacterium]|nr:cyclic nucleotide-binding domain-containing protein [bacterium]